MPHHLRQATSDTDWQDGCALLQHVYVHGGFTTAERAASFMARERLKGEGSFLLAISNADVVLGAVVLLKPDSGLVQFARLGEREFRLLAVHPKARGSGVGEALVRACIKKAKEEGAMGMVLWSQPTMKSAHRLYERLGFLRAPERDIIDPRVTMQVFSLVW